MAKYGIPYMGSKGKICDILMQVLPSATHFYDLFGGGFAVTHAALLSNKYKHFHFNDISDTPEIIQKAIRGEFNYKVFTPHFVSREEFFLKKDTDPYISIVWSFGNNQKNYLFSKEIEPYKRALHNAVIFDEFNDLAVKTLGFSKWPANFKHPTNKRLLVGQTVANRNKGMKSGLQRLEQLQRLQQLQQLQQLERLQRLEQLTFSSVDYREVKINPEDSVVYCDPPYIGTAGYIHAFNHDDFYAWVREAQFPVFISEYTMPEDFKMIGSKSHKSSLSPVGQTDSRENLYVNPFGARKYLGAP